MKRFVCLLMALLLIGSLAACGSNTTAENAVETTAETAAEVQSTSADGVDIDLTNMTGTMVYAEVQNMMMNPKEYLGKTVKMSGAFNVAEIEDNIYYACIIKDATACCSQGIEFLWKGEHSYPEDYPEVGTELTVIGTFNTYKEGIQTYCQLKDADVQF